MGSLLVLSAEIWVWSAFTSSRISSVLAWIRVWSAWDWTWLFLGINGMETLIWRWLGKLAWSRALKLLVWVQKVWHLPLFHEHSLMVYPIRLPNEYCLGDENVFDFRIFGVVFQLRLNFRVSNGLKCSHHLNREKALRKSERSQVLTICWFWGLKCLGS